MNMLWKSLMCRTHARTRPVKAVLGEEHTIQGFSPHSRAASNDWPWTHTHTHRWSHTRRAEPCSAKRKTSRSRLTALQQLNRKLHHKNRGWGGSASDSWGRQQDHVSVAVYSGGRSDSKEEKTLKSEDPWFAIMKWLRFEERLNLFIRISQKCPKIKEKTNKKLYFE